MLRTLPLALLLLAPLAAAQPHAPGRAASDRAGCSGDPHPVAARLSPEALASEGRRLWEGHLARYGPSSRADWREAVGTILGRLVPASGHPGLAITYEVLDYDEVNAWVAPGDYMMVYGGLLALYERIGAERHPNDPEAARAAFERLLAGTLAHEVAHLTLGHPGSLVAAHLAEAPGADLRQRERALNPTALQRFAYGRACETEADRTGALYLLRAGYEIQGMIDFFRAANDLVARAEGDASLSYISTHPHYADRIADLEIFRAELTRHQRRFDDALTLVRYNAELDHAVELLDRVLEDFPDLLAARHARATALHRKWLNEVPIQVQRVRPSLLTFSANFLPGIRGVNAPMHLLRDAAGEYDRLLAERALPETLSNRALVHAHLGEFGEAVRMARRAAELAPDDPAARNNLGVVLLLADEPAEAIATFRQGAEAGDASAYLNLGLVLAEQDDPEAAAVLADYLLLIEDDSGWGAYVESRLEAMGVDPTGGAAPAPEARPAPAVGGIRLGDPEGAVIERLGPPEERAAPVWAYPALGLEIIMAGPRVGGLLAAEGYAEAVEGVRIGMAAEAAARALGPPHHRERDGRAEAWWYAYAGWLLGVAVVDGAVHQVGVIAL